jgi:hypothetical protein
MVYEDVVSEACQFESHGATQETKLCCMRNNRSRVRGSTNEFQTLTKIEQAG